MKNFKNKADLQEYLVENQVTRRIIYIFSVIFSVVMNIYLIYEYFNFPLYTYIGVFFTAIILASPVATITNYYVYYNTATNIIMRMISIMSFYILAYYIIDHYYNYIVSNIEYDHFFYIVATQVITIAIGGLIYGVIISIPLKIFNKSALGSKNLYEDSDLISELSENANINVTTILPRKKVKQKHNDDKQEQIKLELMTHSEIELEVKLKNALKEENYILAKLIKEVLSKNK